VGRAVGQWHSLKEKGHSLKGVQLAPKKHKFDRSRGDGLCDLFPFRIRRTPFFYGLHGVSFIISVWSLFLSA
jgi:hypothetical protein